MLHLFTLCILEGTHALEHLIPVNQCSVKLRTVDADKLSLAANGQSAGTAHTCTIHHNRVEGYICREIIFLSQETAEFHHDRRADGEYLIDVLLIDELFDTDSYNTFLAVTSVIGHDNQFVTGSANFIFHDYQFLVAASNHRENTVACSFEGTHDREHWSYTYTTARTDYCTIVLDMGWVAERTHNIMDFISFVEITEFGR